MDRVLDYYGVNYLVGSAWTAWTCDGTSYRRDGEAVLIKTAFGWRKVRDVELAIVLPEPGSVLDAGRSLVAHQ